MRKVSLGNTSPLPDLWKKWVEDSLRSIEKASYGSQFGELLALATTQADAAFLLSGWRVLGASGEPVSHTGSTAEIPLAELEIAAGAMGANGIIRVTTLWNTTDSANSKTLRVKLGATEFLAHVATTSASQRLQTIIQNRDDQSAQVGYGGGGWGDLSAAVVTGAVDTTLAQNITITAQLESDAEEVTLEAYLIELCKRA